MDKNKKTTIRRLIRAVLKNKKMVLLSLLCAVLGNALLISGPFLIGKAVDNIVGAQNVDFSALLLYVAILGVIYLISQIFQYFLGVLTVVIANRTVDDLRNESFGKLIKMPISFYDTTRHGEVINRLTVDMDAVSEGISQCLKELLSGVVTILGAIVFMLIINPILAAIVIVMTPICFLISSKINKNCRKYFLKQSELNGTLTGSAEEFIQNARLLYAMDCQSERQSRYNAVNGLLYDAGQKAQFYSALVNPSIRLLNYIIYAAIGIVGGILAIPPYAIVTVGNITSFVTYSTSFSQPINNITAVFAQILSAIASAERIFDLIDKEPEKADSDTDYVLPRADGDVQFDRVSFAYTPTRPLIRDFSLTVPRGTHVAIVGPTGAGKTTMVNLLMRFYETDSGDILVCDHPIKQTTRNSLRATIGMVLQDTWLKQGTIFENIAYGAEEMPTLEQVKQVAERAGASGFIERMQHGYDSVLQENAANLSQGQRQLLTIARAMISKPDILILDEATSNVDTRTEQKIQAAFLEMMQGKTSFVIAHRLSTIQEADIILVMENGNIVQSGNHAALLKQEGLYKKLYHAQFEN